MKQLEEMSMEELAREARYLAKRLEEAEAARKEEKQKITELEKQGYVRIGRLRITC